MIFETLYESSQRNELLLIDGGFCHWHLRRDGIVTIREIIATRKGAGGQMLGHIKTLNHGCPIQAKCPSDLPSNAWYERRGFVLVGTETTKTGRAVNLWRWQP